MARAGRARPDPSGRSPNPDGNLYTLQRELNGVARGVLYQVSFSGGGNQPPQIGAQPQDVTVGFGGSATFSVVASGTAPLGYQWRRNGASIPGATGASYTLNNVQAADNGARFSVVVTNQYGSATSREALLTVRNDQPPSASITSPAQGATYAGGDQLTITGTASDPEDGTPPPEAFEWEVVFHHNTHTHPFIEPFSGTRSFTATIPTDDETDTDVFYRIHLRVTDSVGNTTEVTRDVLPRTSTANLQAVPWSWQLTLDGSPVATPTSFAGVVGVRRTLGAPPRTVNGQSWVLDCWEDHSTATERPILMASSASRTPSSGSRPRSGRVATSARSRDNASRPRASAKPRCRSASCRWPSASWRARSASRRCRSASWLFASATCRAAASPSRACSAATP